MPEFNLNVLFNILSSFMTLCIILYILMKARKTALTKSFLFFQVLVFLWPLCGIFHNLLVAMHIYSKLPHFLICIGIQHFTMCFIGTSWFIFCLYFTNAEILKKQWFVPLLLAIAMVYFLIALSMRSHLTSYAVLYIERFWIKTIILTAYIIASIAVLAFYAQRKKGAVARQCVMLIAAISISVVCIMLNAFYQMLTGYTITVFDTTFYPDLDPLGFALSAVITSITIFRHRFLDIMPIALVKVFDTMKEGLLLIDRNNCVINYNPSFQRMFQGYIFLHRGDNIYNFMKLLTGFMTYNSEKLDLNPSFNVIEKQLVNGKLILSRENTCIRISLQPILSKGHMVGKYLLFTDITSVEELALLRERTRIAREIHDTLGHSLTMLLTHLQASNIEYDKHPEEIHKKLEEAIDIARYGLKELQRSVAGMLPGKLENSSLVDALKEMFEHVKPIGVRVEFSAEGSFSFLDKELSKTIYRICQEALTNAVKHGKANLINVVLCIEKNEVKLLFIDNGIGCCGLFTKGVGLTSIETSVKERNGQLQFGSMGGRGFSIFIEIPIRLKNIINDQEAAE